MSKKQLEPLIPLDDLKKFVGAVIAVPKAKIVNAGTKTKRRKAK